jgi:hypothetical protein
LFFIFEYQNGEWAKSVKVQRVGIWKETKKDGNTIIYRILNNPGSNHEIIMPRIVQIIHLLIIQSLAFLIHSSKSSPSPSRTSSWCTFANHYAAREDEENIFARHNVHCVSAYEHGPRLGHRGNDVFASLLEMNY